VDRDEDLPLDPDVEVDDTITPRPRPVHLHPGYLGLVFAGGTLGTLVRYLLSLVIPAWGGMPVPTFVINVTGAFLLGWLLRALSHHGPDHGARRSLRLALGTGFLGGYTTYSAFAVDVDGLIASGDTAAAMLYGLATVVVGAAASVAGIALGAAGARPRAERI
jgi:CrcB protein